MMDKAKFLGLAFIGLVITVFGFQILYLRIIGGLTFIICLVMAFYSMLSYMEHVDHQDARDKLYAERAQKIVAAIGFVLGMTP
jgi:4-hydroxybenzoate polyprenyltransferase